MNHRTTFRIVALVTLSLSGAATAQARGAETLGKVNGSRAVAATQAKRAIALAAERLLMLPGDRADSSPPPPENAAPRNGPVQSAVPVWSSTVGGVGLEPAGVLKRLFGVGHARVDAAPGGKLDLHWVSGKRDRLVGRVDLGSRSGRGPHFEPAPQVLRRRNALVGRALLAEIDAMLAEGKLTAARQQQPKSWRSPAPTAYVSTRFNIQHSLAARLGDKDPLAAALSPVPETHFLFPADVPYSSDRGRALRADWQRWATTVARWIDPRILPVDGPGEPAARGREAHANVRAAQREGWVRPIAIGWRDRDGAHHLELRQVGSRKMAVHRFVPRRLLRRARPR